jgi:undecaprenyl phosphate N,N'-diacetylbacillosamine 1-phosphate transferase
MYQKYFKRVVDLVLALIALALLSPVFLALLLLLLVANRGNPLFLQERAGLQGRRFKVIKFKTMNDRRDAQGQLLSDEARLTPLGRFIRHSSLDELPQLLNVLKGDMSLIGPRPLLLEYLPLYDEQQRRRHELRPGITGWAQVNGRNAISWEEKFAYDVWYVDHLSFALDVKILWLTVRKVLSLEGINAPGSATVEKFKGKKVNS